VNKALRGSRTNSGDQERGLLFENPTSRGVAQIARSQNSFTERTRFGSNCGFWSSFMPQNTSVAFTKRSRLLKTREKILTTFALPLHHEKRRTNPTFCFVDLITVHIRQQNHTIKITLFHHTFENSSGSRRHFDEIREDTQIARKPLHLAYLGEMLFGLRWDGRDSGHGDDGRRPGAAGMAVGG